MSALRQRSGALYTATHADSRAESGAELEEGGFFIWSPSEIEESLTFEEQISESEVV